MHCWRSDMGRNRVCYFDVLRVASIFFVIVIHVTSAGMKLCAPVTAVWRVNWLVNSISRWAVPVFFMVSGALFLEPSRELTLKKLHKKNILRIVVCIMGISLLVIGSIPLWNAFREKRSGCRVWNRYREYWLSPVVSLYAAYALHCCTSFSVNH